MIGFRTVDMTPAHLRYALGYACTSAWAVVLLIAPVFNIPDSIHAAPASMLPGLLTCLASLFFAGRFPSIAGRTGAVALSSLLMALGTLLSTFPAASSGIVVRLAGLVLSGMFAIILIMAWFDVFSRLRPRAVIVLSGCAITIAAVMCWGILSCDPSVSSVLTSLLPMLSFVMLPSPETRETSVHTERIPADENSQPAGKRGVMEIASAALPVRTLVGLAITFFIVNSLGALAPRFGEFSNAVSPLSLLATLGVTAFFVASALLVRKKLDPTILYKILMFAFAAIVLLLTFSIGVSASLVFFAAIVAEVMMWTVLALLAKKTPVNPHQVFAVGWIAECVGRVLGQTTAPLFSGEPHAFFAVAIMLILVAVGFAFSEGSLMLDVGFEDEDDGGSSEKNPDADASDSPAASTDAPGASAEIDEASAAQQESAEKAAAEGAAAASTRVGNENENEGPNPLDTFVASYDISKRERDVLELWLAGRGLKYIENALFISESTVKSHLRSIYRKCDTHSRDEIISLYERSFEQPTR